MATIDNIITRAEGIRDETTIGANTATRVGSVMVDTAEHVKQNEQDISSIDSRVTTAETTLNALDTSIKKEVYTSGEVLYSVNSITFKAGSSLYYKDNAQGASNHIDFVSDTTYTATSSTHCIVLRSGAIALSSTANVLATDTELLKYSSSVGEFVSGNLYTAYVNSTIVKAVTGLPFERGGYSGVNNNWIVYSTSANRLRVMMPTAGLGTIRPKSGYRITGLVYQDIIPTANFSAVTALTPDANAVIDIPTAISSISTFDPNMVLVAISKTDNSNFDASVDSVDGMLDVTLRTFPAKTLAETPKTIRRFGLLGGNISTSTGQNTNINANIPIYKHIPRYIRFTDDITIKDANAGGVVLFYDESKTYLGYVTMSSINRFIDRKLHNGTYIRISFSSNSPYILPYDGVELESRWGDGDVEEFLERPSDDGYTNLTFPVRINTCTQPDHVTSSITTEFTDSVNWGVLHLPETYSANGKPTPLILYIHGAAERYNNSSVRFGTKVRYSPEWSSMGYAQMDVDMIPLLYGYSGTDSSGTGDDVACIEAAYNWVIEHYNIRRDGVYLFGRSRGAEAVLGILARYNPNKMPVICALSNAGANTMLLYGLYRTNPTSTWWAAFCKAFGLDGLTPPAIATNKPIINQSGVVDFLRTNIDIWWGKAMCALGMMVHNPTAHQSPLQILNLLETSYNDTDAGKTYIKDFVEQCTFHSPVPLRFDWCKGDTVQKWEADAWGNYGSAGKNAFVNSMMGNAIYREWPTCPVGDEPHYHEQYNLYSGTYTLPNGATIANPSMAMIEWMTWALSIDPRAL